MECEFCKKVFSTKSNLNSHQKRAGYCLEMQGKCERHFECNDCHKQFNYKKILIDHAHTCKEKKKKEIINKDQAHLNELEKQRNDYEGRLRNLDERLRNLEEQLREKDRIISEIALQPRGTTHTHTDNRVQTILTGHFDMSNVSRVSDVLDEFLDKDVVAMGQKGLGEMIATRLLRDEEGKQLYVCTDLSRHHFKFVNTEGLTETDPKAYRLIGLIQEAGLSSKTAEVMQAIYDEFDHSDADSPEVYSQSILELMTLKRDSSKFRSVLASVTAKGST